MIVLDHWIGDWSNGLLLTLTRLHRSGGLERVSSLLSRATVLTNSGFYEDGNKALDSIKDMEFLDQPSEYHILKRNMAPWN
jgi:hypothetical protein